MKITAVTCVKNEGPFLLEWIAFNRVIGVTDFLFYSNDCTDGTDKILDCLQSHGVVTHLPNPAGSRKYQMQALKAAREHPLVQSSDWVWVADVDEFLNIHCANGTIPGLISACGNPKAISASYQFMANDGVEAFEDMPVISQFLRTHHPDVWGDETCIEVKSLVRNDFPFGSYGAHRPMHRETKESPAWTDGSGRPVIDSFRKRENKETLRAFPAKGARDLCTLNHYPLRSLDSYLVKHDRGDVNRENRTFNKNYWKERNDNSYFDNRILKHGPALMEEISRLKGLPDVAALHAKTVVQHKHIRDRLLADIKYKDLYNSLRTDCAHPVAKAKRPSRNGKSRLRIVNLALPKTGTTTLTCALRMVGLSVADWAIRAGQFPNSELDDIHLGQILYEDYFDSGDPLARLDSFDCINEMSAVGRYRSLWPQTDFGLLKAIERKHPGVKFILTTRDSKKTVDSMMRWNNLGKKRLPNAAVPGLPRGFGHDLNHLEKWIINHYAFCRAVFGGADNFFEYDIEDSNARKELSEYLGLELPWWGKTNVGK